MTINVSGLTGTTTDVNVTFTGMNNFEGDFEILLVGPANTAAQSLVLLSDAGSTDVSNHTLTIDDSATSVAPQNGSWGASPSTFRPTDYQELVGVGAPADTYPAPAPASVNHPAPTGSSTLASVFNGASPNGTWRLYVVSDACDAPAETITGGWSLSITSASLTATTTTVSSSVNPSTTGQGVTFTAGVTGSGSPVTSGTVTFTEGATTLAANVAVNGSGNAGFTTSSLPEGNHVITATYNGTATFATSNNSVNQRVDNATTVNGNTFCNTGPIAVKPGSATPYPSHISVSALGGQVGKVTAQLKNVSHQFAEDIDALLVGPNGANSVVLVSDAGNGSAATSNVSITFSDTAAGSVPATGAWGAANSSVSARATDYAPAGAADAFPAPAPLSFGASAPTGTATLASAFAGTSPNGTWSLYIVDDGAPDTGSIAGGWCLTVTPMASLATSASGSVAVGGQVRDTAVLSGGQSPTGSIVFSLFGPDDATCSAAAVFTSSAVVVSGNGSYDSPSFTPTAPGTYRWRASYSGDANNLALAGACNAANESVSVQAASQPPIVTTNSTPSVTPSPTTTVAPGLTPAAMRDTTPPTVSSLGLTNSPFAVAGGSTPTTGMSAAKRYKKGTTFRYTLSEAATVRLVIARTLTGRRDGTRCLAPTPKLRKAKKCTRLSVRGTLTRISHAGANRVAFSGRIGSKALRPGRYRATLTATDAGMNTSKPALIGFVIVKTSAGR